RAETTGRRARAPRQARWPAARYRRDRSRPRSAIPRRRIAQRDPPSPPLMVVSLVFGSYPMCWSIAILGPVALGMPDDRILRWARSRSEWACFHPLPLMPSPTVVGFAGMTHLGVVSAAATAARGFTVLGYDADRDLVDRLRSGDMPIVEPALEELVAEHRERIGFTADEEDLARCDLVYIAADVPTDDQAKSDLAPIGVLVDRVTCRL